MAMLCQYIFSVLEIMPLIKKRLISSILLEGDLQELVLVVAGELQAGVRAPLLSQTLPEDVSGAD
jgi:hypothetical protein